MFHLRLNGRLLRAEIRHSARNFKRGSYEDFRPGFFLNCWKWTRLGWIASAVSLYRRYWCPSERRCLRGLNQECS